MSSKKLKAEQQQQLFDALTALQKKFALAIVKGKNQTDAYKSAKGKAKGEATRLVRRMITTKVTYLRG
ncbi:MULTISPECIES: hypothetical protein [Enterobacteriaceae]|uniref:hypothetical protein n=1 Tax=Enterobacter kobei TaxID=208224 RepID=UPI0006DB3348|nr:hypothetical protein [Enterobacter kobei]EIY1673186.1 hypothetical protein [Escherichia coli]EKT0182545.1 hypothetical protein [Escherichia coli]OEH03281.1 hypothetical protein AN674_0214170 [Enterobacter kobei]